MEERQLVGRSAAVVSLQQLLRIELGLGGVRVGLGWVELNGVMTRYCLPDYLLLARAWFLFVICYLHCTRMLSPSCYMSPVSNCLLLSTCCLQFIATTCHFLSLRVNSGCCACKRIPYALTSIASYSAACGAE